MSVLRWWLRSLLPLAFVLGVLTLSALYDGVSTHYTLSVLMVCGTVGGALYAVEAALLAPYRLRWRWPKGCDLSVVPSSRRAGAYMVWGMLFATFMAGHYTLRQGQFSAGGVFAAVIGGLVFGGYLGASTERRLEDQAA